MIPIKKFVDSYAGIRSGLTAKYTLVSTYFANEMPSRHGIKTVGLLLASFSRHLSALILLLNVVLFGSFFPSNAGQDNPQNAGGSFSPISQTAPNWNAREIVIIGSEVVQADGLVSEQSGREIYRLRPASPENDPLDEIVSILSQYRNLKSIHLITHGRHGLLEISGKQYSATGLEALYRNQLQAIGNSLSPDGDILLYGCDIASNSAGRQLASVLSRYSGADIGASTNTTGHTELNGDWLLEYHVGNVSSEVAVSTQAKAEWRFELATSLLDWSTRPALVDLETGGTDVATVDGITVTTSGTLVGSRTSDTLTLEPATTLNGYLGILSSALDATIDDESVYNEFRFDFSEPVYDLRFRTIDVDGFSDATFRFSDLMIYSSSAGVPSSATAGASVTYTPATGRAIENATANCTGDDANCQVNVVFDGPITFATIRHVAAAAVGGSNPTNQAIQIFDLTFNTPPDATNNTNALNSDVNVSGNVLSDDDGNGTDSDRQDGASVLVNQVSHPDGTVSVGGGGATLNLSNGAFLTIAQDGSYTFNPNGAYQGLPNGTLSVETFTYRIEDQEGLFNEDGDLVSPDSLATLVITVTTVSPEIDVSGLGVSIADGDVTPEVTDDTDFGAHDITTGSNANTFTITNTGSALLNLSGSPRVTIGGAHAADFTLTTDAATSVAASGGTTTFIITFDPTAVGLRTATVSIANDDADENPYNFSIQGTGAEPEMTISKTPDVASVNNAGDDITYTITLTNTGSISITGITVSDPLLTSISCTPGSGPNPSDMAPAAVTTCTGTYSVTQADFDTNGGGDGDIDNTATVTANGGLSETASAAVTLNTNTDLTIAKSADDTTQVVVGQVITYTYVVTNNGNLTITDVFINDTHNGSGPAPVPSNETLTIDNTPLGDTIDGSTDGSWDTLAPGDAVSFTATYAVTQSDVDTLQ